MIIVRAPLRISFVGGGSDLPDFYNIFPGQVLSTTIDKFVYVAINPTPLLNGISARYSTVETVKKARDLKNDRIREALLYLKIKDNMEFGVFSDLPIGTGLGGSSSFSVALIKGLSTYLGKRLDTQDIASVACYIEINTLKQPIGKQDQYASAFGGFNIFHFNSDDKVVVDPILLDYKKRIDLENRMLVFFTGMTRESSSVLEEQKSNTAKYIENLKSMTNLVDIFNKNLMKGNFEILGEILHDNWLKKKSLASKISNHIIDELYETGIKNGAWGGKLLGAGGGGCIMFLASLQKKDKVRYAIKQKARKLQLAEFKEIPIKFVQAGVEVISNSNFN